MAIDPVSRDMNVASLRSAIEADVAAGGPALVVASLGSTGVTAFDPLPEIVDRVRPYGAWIHADAAMAGSALLLPEYRHLFAGIEDADSISWNPHKWMGTILDTSLLYLRDPEHLIRVMSTNPSYLQSTAGGEATQYRDWAFRSVDGSERLLWYQLRIDGPDAIAERLRRSRQRPMVADQIENRPDWHVVAFGPAPDRLCSTYPADACRRCRSDQRLQPCLGSSSQPVEAFLSPSQLDDG